MRQHYGSYPYCQPRCLPQHPLRHQRLSPTASAAFKVGYSSLSAPLSYIIDILAYMFVYVNRFFKFNLCGFILLCGKNKLLLFPAVYVIINQLNILIYFMRISKMKKITLILLVLSIVVAFASCGMLLLSLYPRAELWRRFQLLVVHRAFFQPLRGVVFFFPCL